MKWVSMTPMSEVDLYLKLPSWHEWMKLFEIIMNCIFCQSLSQLIYQ